MQQMLNKCTLNEWGWGGAEGSALLRWTGRCPYALPVLIPAPEARPGLGPSLTIELVLDDVVEGLQQEEDQVVVLGSGEEEPGGGEGLQQVQQLIGS